ncbi:MAG TPA: aminotransferase class III-fold pyridoxal phosphate-dependent enzyme [Candidatus Ruania gallistercoris]|uniref:Aminotransferase class III-fold pyridoxal phosphate-dependent enzyme n=1 Tax=Candidatus Ruania gallistercoris TaxID=2838746 RepID=A0A9D2EE14_9MICO|nr:aminotransferase class III-fold pyridoxal phosphate-dependent enzyme [Candidatus Ruania gallistercoris]
MPEQTDNATSWSGRLAAVMPFGSSTASKAPRLLPDEPEVIVRGDGCRVWDERGREFIDYRNSLGPVSLGYRYPAVDEAIRAQLDQGIVFGHPTPLEAEVAERLCAQLPGMDQARFLKTGGEAIAAAIRIARSYTGRDHVIQTGYNGWLNALGAGAAALPGQPAPVPAGVPAAVAALHHPVPWNDLGAVEQILTTHPGQVAAMVVAADYAAMADGAPYYPQLRALLDRHGVLLILDEIVTGFRIALGGVNEYFQVGADLMVYGKGMANGMPIAVYTGRREVMAACGPGRAVVSSTFGGEALSLAAAAACLDTYTGAEVIGHLWRQGAALRDGLNAIFQAREIPLVLTGLAPCPTFRPTDDQGGVLDTFFRAAYRQGVSLTNVPFVNYSHTDADIAETLHRLDQAGAEVAGDVAPR